MTNRLALILLIVIAGVVWFDQTSQDGAWAVFIGRKLVDLIDWVAFWR